MHHVQSLGTVGRGHYLEALQLEIDPDQLPDDLVVVHNKHAAGHAWHNSRVGRPRPPRPAFADFHLHGEQPGDDDAPHGPSRATSRNLFMNTRPELVVFNPSPLHHGGTPP
ncbi:hypothetical protein GCM10010346_51270 [Streptomyces chryseus]|uniref:Uncharacterized protein n=1 Tax=Streptomyces chryseus TaxID=68186 RepID=A0ABQ3E046_9ACTN|nr:hypothetical protein GCM10010346_51270 [Streptomyces chryseus]